MTPVVPAAKVNVPMEQIKIWSPSEVMASFTGWGAEESATTAGGALVVVSLDAPGPGDEAARLLRTLPLVSVCLSHRASGSSTAHGFDVALTEAESPPAPWVGVGDVQAELRRLAEAVTAAPATSVALVQLLRMGESLGVTDALIAESLTYAMLQSGPEHRAWLDSRAPGTTRTSVEPAVLVERDGDRLLVTLNRPDVHNAFDIGIRDGLAEALRLVAADGTIAEMHLRGRGPTFCSGGDLSEFGSLPDPVTGHLVRSTRGAGGLLHRVSDRVIAHLHGTCYGAGVEVPAFAGRVTATPDTRFVLPELRLGLIPGAGGTASIPRRIGRQRTAWLALTGHALDSATALQWGLVDEIEIRDHPHPGRNSTNI